MENYYQILGIEKDANQDQIKQAYLRQLKKYHPDLYKGDKQTAQQKTIQLNQIYETLKNQDLRKQYDQTVFKTPTKKLQTISVLQKLKALKNNCFKTNQNQLDEFEKNEISEKTKLCTFIGVILMIILTIILICLSV